MSKKKKKTGLKNKNNSKLVYVCSENLGGTQRHALYHSLESMQIYIGLNKKKKNNLKPPTNKISKLDLLTNSR